MAKDILQMSREEIDRLVILRSVLKGDVTQLRAAEVLGLSDRQVRRLVKRIAAEGDEGIIHRSRGRPSARKMSEEREAEIKELVGLRYADFGPTLIAEKLREREGITVSREKLRQLLMEDGLWKRRRRHKRVHVWRARKDHCGQMVQMDGSHHDWFEGRGARLVLMGYIDDATGRFYGRFYDYEGVYPAMDSLERYMRRYGRPLSLYLDKHSTYKTTRQACLDELLSGQSAATQFERACRELGIDVIHAHSPQAKGRIERAFGTLQDRLVKEMRLANISTLEQANEFLDLYLPCHNQKFARQPLKSKDLHRRLPVGIRYRDIFCVKEKRTILRSYTVKWKGRELLLDKPSIALRGRRVEVREHFDGQIEILFNRRRLRFKEITEKKVEAKSLGQTKKTIRKGKYIPPANHPWRRHDPALHHLTNIQRIGQ